MSFQLVNVTDDANTSRQEASADVKFKLFLKAPLFFTRWFFTDLFQSDISMITSLLFALYFPIYPPCTTKSTQTQSCLVLAIEIYYLLTSVHCVFSKKLLWAYMSKTVMWSSISPEKDSRCLMTVPLRPAFCVTHAASKLINSTKLSDPEESRCRQRRFGWSMNATVLPYVKMQFSNYNC